MNKVILNGAFDSRESLKLTAENRAFKYGDGLFETMHVEDHKVRFFMDHFHRLTNGMRILGMETPDHFHNLEPVITGFLKNNNLKTGTLRWQVWRKDGGKYSPLRNETESIIEFKEKEELNAAIKLGISNNSTVSYGPVSRFKTCNALPYVLAGIEMQTTEFNDLILLNQEQKVAECMASNIFWSNNKHWYTPSVSTGCVEGIMRNHVIKEMKKSGTPLIEGEFGIEYFLDIQKAFLTNSGGIYPVAVLGELTLSNQLNLPEELDRLRVF